MERFATFGFDRTNRFLVASLIYVDTNQNCSGSCVSVSGFSSNTMASSGDLSSQDLNYNFNKKKYKKTI